MITPPENCAKAGAAIPTTSTVIKLRRITMPEIIASSFTINPMDFGISTWFYSRRLLTVDLLESLRKQEFNRIEIFSVRPHFDFHSRSLQRSVGRWFYENEMPAPSIHLPFIEYVGRTQEVHISPLDSERRNREAAMDEIKRSLELAEYVKPEYVVMHLGIPGQPFNPTQFDLAFAAINNIRDFSGVRVLIENIPNELSTLDRLQDFKTAAQLPDVGLCYDIGHGQLPSLKDGLKQPVAWNTISAMHINDNRGAIDEHLWPFEGRRNWPEFIAECVIAKYSGSFLLEVIGNNDLNKGTEVRHKLGDLWDEAQNSIEEFRLKYNLSETARKTNHDARLH